MSTGTLYAPVLRRTYVRGEDGKFRKQVSSDTLRWRATAVPALKKKARNRRRNALARSSRRAHRS